MQTDYVRMHFGFAIRSHDDSVKVLDDTKAVAAERKIVGAVSGTAVTKVEGLLSVEWWASIRVRYCHLANTHAIQDASSIVVDVMENRAFSRIERYAEAPFLPLDERLLCDFEGGTFWLCNVDGLHVPSQAASYQLRYVFGRLAMIENSRRVCLTCQAIALATRCKPINANNLLCVSVHYWDDW